MTTLPSSSAYAGPLLFAGAGEAAAAATGAGAGAAAATGASSSARIRCGLAARLITCGSPAATSAGSESLHGFSAIRRQNSRNPRRRPESGVLPSCLTDASTCSPMRILIAGSRFVSTPSRNSCCSSAHSSGTSKKPLRSVSAASNIWYALWYTASAGFVGKLSRSRTNGNRVCRSVGKMNRHAGWLNSLRNCCIVMLPPASQPIRAMLSRTSPTRLILVSAERECCFSNCASSSASRRPS